MIRDFKFGNIENTVVTFDKIPKKLGFKKVAHFKEVGRKFDQWHDVAFWQLTF